MRISDVFYVAVLLYALICFIRGRIKQGLITILFLVGITLMWFFISMFLFRFVS